MYKTEEQKKQGMAEAIKRMQGRPEFTGTCYYHLDDVYAMVLSWDAETGLCGKIAYNTDDLQCDYDWDWYMPLDASGEVIDTEVTGIENDAPEQLAADFMEAYNNMKKQLPDTGDDN